MTQVAVTLNFLVSTQAKKARFALDGERVALAPLKGNNHLQRCYRSAAPVAGARLTAECADCGAHDALRLSQVIWASDDVRQ